MWPFGKAPLGERVARRQRRERAMRRVKVLTCPDCGSSDLYYETGLITGYKYHCKSCEYVGSFVIEKEVNEGETPPAPGEQAPEKDGGPRPDG